MFTEGRICRAIPVALLVAGLALAGCGSALATELRAAEAERSVPEGLTVVYDDHDTRWGGERIEIRGDGSMEVRRWRPGQSEEPPQQWSGEVPEEAVRQLVEVLVDIEAWEQHGEETAPRIDDAKARLTIRIGAEEESIWEWANDLEANRRLFRVKQHLDALAFELRHPLAE